MNSNPYRTPGIVDTSYEKKEDPPKLPVAKKSTPSAFVKAQKLITLYNLAKHEYYEFSEQCEIIDKIEKLYGKILSITPKEVSHREGVFDYICEMLDGSKVNLRNYRGYFNKTFFLHHEPANMVSADLTEP